MKQHPTLPTFGEIVPGEGGRLGGIMRGAMVNGVRQPDYALIVPDMPTISLPWGKYDEEVKGADSLTDGLTNTQAMLKKKCPPALHISKMTVDGHSDFYLPARGELWALRANAPELFDKVWHWGSTQLSRNTAIVQAFEVGFSHWDGKDAEYRVRAVRRVQLHHFNA